MVARPFHSLDPCYDPIHQLLTSKDGGEQEKLLIFISSSVKFIPSVFIPLLPYATTYVRPIGLEIVLS